MASRRRASASDSVAVASPPPPTIRSSTSGKPASRSSGSARMTTSTPFRGTRRPTDRIRWVRLRLSAGPEPGKRSRSTPHGAIEIFSGGIPIALSSKTSSEQVAMIRSAPRPTDGSSHRLSTGLVSAHALVAAFDRAQRVEGLDHRDLDAGGPWRTAARAARPDIQKCPWTRSGGRRSQSREIPLGQLSHEGKEFVLGYVARRAGLDVDHFKRAGGSGPCPAGRPRPAWCTP